MSYVITKRNMKLINSFFKGFLCLEGKIFQLRIIQCNCSIFRISSLFILQLPQLIHSYIPILERLQGIPLVVYINGMFTSPSPSMKNNTQCPFDKTVLICSIFFDFNDKVNIFRFLCVKMIWIITN